MNQQVMKLLPFSRTWLLALMVTALLSAGLALVVGRVALAQGSYDYTVQEGESWDTVASRTGVSVEALKEANPEAAARENGWLLVGETLAIPNDPVVPTRTHTVTAGESWNSIADRYNISVSLLRAANPQSIRTGNVLYRGEVLVIPTPGASTRTPAATPTPTASAVTTETVEATVEATEEVTAEATAEATTMATPTATDEATATMTSTASVTATATLTVAADVTATEEVSATATDTVTAAITETGTVTETGAVTETDTAAGVPTEGVDEAAFDLPACPERFADYSQTMADLINSVEEDGLDAVIAFLDACDALVDDGVVVVDLNGDGRDDLVVVYQNPSAEQIFVEGDLVIFNSAADGYVLGYRARAAGEVRLLTVEDINLDELPDVVWVDTTCGASTCFDTVNVRSWDGTSWADWTDGTITMAYAEINLADVAEEGLGNEIALEGGIYGSVGAGPQRSRLELWMSVDGAPYTLVEKSYSATECLYHTVLDANRAFLDGPQNGFEAAVTLYTQAIEDEALLKCWVRNDELAELRSFSLFRLALIAGYSDDAETAAAQIAELTAQYPGSIYDEVGQVWLESYEASGDAALACDDVTTFAEENSVTWEMLADYGYTNPSFEAIDVCPYLAMPSVEEEEAE